MGSTAAEGSGQGLDQRYASQAIADEDDQEADNFAICKLRSCTYAALENQKSKKESQSFSKLKFLKYLPH